MTESWISDSPTKSLSSPAAAAGSGWPARSALVAEGCRVCICARGEERLAEAAVEVEAASRKRPNMVTAVQADVSTDAGVERVIETRRRRIWRARHSRQQRRARRRRRTSWIRRDAEWQAAFDETLFPAIRASRLAVPHMRAARRRRDRHDRVDLRPRGRRPHDLQRRESGRNQPGQVARAAAGADQHPREQRRARARSSFPAARGTGASRPIPRASPTSSAASCRSAASDAPTKSARSWRSSPPRAPAGSAARASRSTAAREVEYLASFQLSALSSASAKSFRA